MKHKVILAGLFAASAFLLFLGDKSWFMYFVFFLVYMIFFLIKKIKEGKKTEKQKSDTPQR